MARPHFYVTLPSKASNVDFPRNTSSRFRVRLKDSVRLDGPYEVGLETLIYPLTMYNVVEERNEIVFTSAEQEWTVSIPRGYYKDTGALVTAVDEIIQDTHMRGRASFRFDPRTGCVVLSLNNMGVKFPEKSLLATLLGFSAGMDYTSGEWGGCYPDTQSIRHMYVYCDIVKHSMVGHHSVPLLRVLKVGGDYGDVVERDFLNKQYRPVTVSEFDTLEIALGDNAGVPIRFQGGEVVVVLHFKPCQRI